MSILASDNSANQAEIIDYGALPTLAQLASRNEQASKYANRTLIACQALQESREQLSKAANVATEAGSPTERLSSDTSNNTSRIAEIESLCRQFNPLTLYIGNQHRFQASNLDIDPSRLKEKSLGYTYPKPG